MNAVFEPGNGATRPPFMGKILVTGGAGFIGSTLVDRIVAAGADVVVLDDLSLGSRANLSRSEPRIRVIVDRVENLAAHHAALAGVETVVHLAAQISGYDSLREPRTYVDANVGGLLTVLETMRAIGAKRIVFASSATVYGDASGATLRESDLPRPITTYALTKLAGEHLLRMYGGLWGFTHTSLRLFNVYGPRQSPDHPYANVTCKFTHAAARGLGVKLYGDGEQSRDFVFVDDVVDAFVRALEPTPSGVYNVGTGAETSIRTLLETVQQASETKLEVEQCPPWPNDVRSVRADLTLLERELGLHPRTPLVDGLRRTFDYFRSAAR
jgi:UDP-glucose 4-epimerase